MLSNLINELSGNSRQLSPFIELFTLCGNSFYRDKLLDSAPSSFYCEYYNNGLTVNYKPVFADEFPDPLLGYPSVRIPMIDPSSLSIYFEYGDVCKLPFMLPEDTSFDELYFSIKPIVMSIIYSSTSKKSSKEYHTLEWRLIFAYDSASTTFSYKWLEKEADYDPELNIIFEQETVYFLKPILDNLLAVYILFELNTGDSINYDDIKDISPFSLWETFLSTGNPPVDYEHGIGSDVLSISIPAIAQDGERIIVHQVVEPPAEGEEVADYSIRIQSAFSVYSQDLAPCDIGFEPYKCGSIVTEQHTIIAKSPVTIPITSNCNDLDPGWYANIAVFGFNRTLFSFDVLLFEASVSPTVSDLVNAVLPFLELEYGLTTDLIFDTIPLGDNNVLISTVISILETILPDYDLLSFAINFFLCPGVVQCDPGSAYLNGSCITQTSFLGGTTYLYVERLLTGYESYLWDGAECNLTNSIGSSVPSNSCAINSNPNQSFLGYIFPFGLPPLEVLKDQWTYNSPDPSYDNQPGDPLRTALSGKTIFAPLVFPGSGPDGRCGIEPSTSFSWWGARIRVSPSIDNPALNIQGLKVADVIDLNYFAGANSVFDNSPLQYQRNAQVYHIGNDVSTTSEVAYHFLLREFDNPLNLKVYTPPSFDYEVSGFQRGQDELVLTGIGRDNISINEAIVITADNIVSINETFVEKAKGKDLYQITVIGHFGSYDFTSLAQLGYQVVRNTLSLGQQVISNLEKIGDIFTWNLQTIAQVGNRRFISYSLSSSLFGNHTIWSSEVFDDSQPSGTQTIGSHPSSCRIIPVTYPDPVGRQDDPNPDPQCDQSEYLTLKANYDFVVPLEDYTAGLPLIDFTTVSIPTSDIISSFNSPYTSGDTQKGISSILVELEFSVNLLRNPPYPHIVITVSFSCDVPDKIYNYSFGGFGYQIYAEWIQNGTIDICDSSDVVVYSSPIILL